MSKVERILGYVSIIVALVLLLICVVLFLPYGIAVTDTTFLSIFVLGMVFLACGIIIIADVHFSERLRIEELKLQTGLPLDDLKEKKARNYQKIARAIIIIGTLLLILSALTYIFKEQVKALLLSLNFPTFSDYTFPLIVIAVALYVVGFAVMFGKKRATRVS